MKFEIGQTVFRASWEPSETHITCPDCGGTGRLRVTFHDETQVSIGCANCAKGYEPPRGYLTVYTRTPRAILTTITGVEIEGIQTHWRTFDSYRVAEGDIFLSEAEALERAKAIAAAANKEERDRILLKEKDTRSWAWNASYHRREIKECERRIEHHKAKLAVAAIKAKEDRLASPLSLSTQEEGK